MAASSVVGARSELRLGSVSGYLRFLFLCDVAEEIDLELLTTVLGDPDTRKGLVPSGPASPWNQFERPPVIQALPPLALNSGRSWDVLAKYYEYGVIAVEFTMPFELAWSQLVPSSADHISNAGLDVDAAGIARGCLEHARPALKKPYDRVANEDYAIVELRPARLRTGGFATARELIEANGAEIASMLRGEATALSEEEASHILQSPHVLLSNGLGGGRMGRSGRLRHAIRGRDDYRAAGVRQHSVAGAEAL